MRTRTPTFEDMQADCMERGCSLGRAEVDGNPVYGHARFRLEGVAYGVTYYNSPDLARVDMWRHQQHAAETIARQRREEPWTFEQ